MFPYVFQAQLQLIQLPYLVYTDMSTDTQYVYVNYALDTGMGAVSLMHKLAYKRLGKLPEMINKCSSP